MASYVDITPILDGSRNTIIRVDIFGETASDLDLETIFDASDYLNTGKHKRLIKIQYQLSDFYGDLYWEMHMIGPYPTPLLSLEKDHYQEACFEKIGGVNNSGIASATGNILLSTNGLTTNGRGYIILHLQSRDIVPGER